MIIPIYFCTMDNKLIEILLKTAVNQNASDLHVVSKEHPYLRVDGGIKALKLKNQEITPDFIDQLVLSSLTDYQKQVLEEDLELDYLYSIDDFRFRANAYKSQGHYEAVFRVIKNEILDLSTLNIPDAVNDLGKEHSGLVIVVGATSSGKSTTMAGMIDKINQRESYVIMTIEDPVEFIHKSKKSVISQREVGIDTKSFPRALKSALRQDPDVIVIGEIRDKETARIALESAQTGHLVLATMHASEASDAINRFINLFSESEKDLARLMLSDTLKGIVAQRLVKDVTDSRLPLVEILINDLHVSEIIKQTDDTTIVSAMEAGSGRGMQTFEDSILDYLRQKRITLDTARKNCSNVQSLNIRLRKHGITG